MGIWGGSSGGWGGSNGGLCASPLTPLPCARASHVCSGCWTHRFCFAAAFHFMDLFIIRPCPPSLSVPFLPSGTPKYPPATPSSIGLYVAVSASVRAGPCARARLASPHLFVGRHAWRRQVSGLPTSSPEGLPERSPSPVTIPWNPCGNVLPANCAVNDLEDTNIGVQVCPCLPRPSPRRTAVLPCQLKRCETLSPNRSRTQPSDLRDIGGAQWDGVRENPAGR